MTLEKILNQIEPIDKDSLHEAKKHSEKLIMPNRAMGFLHNIGEQICGIRGTLTPKVNKKAIFIMVADNGVAEENISAYPQEVTNQMVEAFLDGVATINVIANVSKAKLIVADIGMITNLSRTIMDSKNCIFINKKIKRGTSNFLKKKAMTYNEAITSIETGFNIANKYINKYNLNLIATGDMGIGNTTAAAAIASVICGINPVEATGKGSLISSEALLKKIDIVKKAIEVHKPDNKNAIDVLSKVGGLEIGAIAGAILAAAYKKIPVVLDGAISTAGALLAFLLNRKTRDYMIAGHLSAEPSHKYMLDYLSLNPLLRLDMRLGEGTGAAVAIPIIQYAVKIIKKVATFEKANVSKGK
jgi:nicotinate-nucleotide--dimethylbenzimidazole phosphoribosyltransferase